nr:PREDICTED: zinc finger protein 696-like [Lepisosteus oculatus]
MNRKRAAEPVSGRPAGGERLKARCPTAEWGAALLEGTSGSERAVHLELACAVERAVKAAVELAMARVTRLVERRCAGLRLRIEDRERELESVRLRLDLAESELRVLRERVGGGEREPWHAAPQSESRGRAQRRLEAGDPAGRGEFLPVNKKEGDLVNTVAAPSSFPGVTGTLSAKQELYNPPDCEASGEERATDQRQGPTVKRADRTSPRIDTPEAHGRCIAGEQGCPAPCQALQPFGSSQDTSERLSGADCRPLKQEVSELGYGDVVQESRWPPSPLGAEGSEPGPGQAAGPYSSNAQTGRGKIEGNPRSSRGSISQDAAQRKTPRHLAPPDSPPGGRRLPLPPPAAEGGGPRRRGPFACALCGRAFHALQSLQSHQRTHTGERPFPCATCGKSFAQKQNLIRHRSVHTGLAPHACGLCGKRFSQLGNLRIHYLIHTGERPHACPQCGRRFNQAQNLKRHLRVHAKRL